MNGYVRFKDYSEDFYTDAFARGIKGDGSVLLDSALRVHSTHEKSKKWYTKTLEQGKAMYLYGGRKALVQEFTDFKRAFGDFVLTPPETCWLSVYHDKITVEMNKTKRILMITSFRKTSDPPSAISDRRLILDMFEYWNGVSGKSNMGLYRYLDLAGLDRIVRALPD